jgi:putative flippase GtrA
MKLATHMLDPQLLRFAAVGVLNTAFGYLIYAMILWVGLSYAVAAAVATVLGVLFNFKSTGRFVFGSRDNKLLFRFSGVYVLVYLANVLGLTLLTEFGLSAYTAGLLTLLPAAVLAFVLNKAFVFRGSS